MDGWVWCGGTGGHVGVGVLPYMKLGFVMWNERFELGVLVTCDM